MSNGIIRFSPGSAHPFGELHAVTLNGPDHAGSSCPECRGLGKMRRIVHLCEAFEGVKVRVRGSFERIDTGGPSNEKAQDFE